YPFSVVVSDGSLTDTRSITITVAEVNVAPVLANVPSAVTIPEEQAYTFTRSEERREGTANTLTFSLYVAPAGASIDPSTAVFTPVPTEAHGPGSYPFSVQVTDDGGRSLSDSQSITITVSEVNVAPVLANVPSAVTIPEEQAYTFT